MKDYSNIVKYTWQYLKPHKKVVFGFMLVVVLNELVDLMNSLLLGVAIDSMLQTKTVEAIMQVAILFLGLNLLSFVICYFAQMGGTKAMEISRIEAKRQISRHIERTSLKYGGTTGTMSFMQKLNFDSAYLVMFVINSGGHIPGRIFVFLFAIIAIFSIDMICGFIALAELPIIVFLYKAFQSRLLESSRMCSEKREEGNRGLYALIQDVGHIKKNQIFSLLEKRYQKVAAAEVKSAMDATKIDYFYSIINDNMDMFLKVFLFFYGGYSVISGGMTVGEFTIVYSYFSSVTSACTYFLNLGNEVQTHKAFYERLKKITDVPEETNGTMQIKEIEEIQMSNVNFGYNDNEIVLTNFTQTFHKGKLYVISGSNGCGKSTMLSLLMGMYIDEHQGEITYNGFSIKELDMRMLRKEHIGVCEQEPYLIEDTIRYNMIYSNDTTNDEKLMQLAYQVSFDDFLSNSENGLDTQVGESGNALSGGQKQKTALVKVFYKNPDVLVLDEPTSAMDVKGQDRFISYLTSIKKDKIIIVITHDERMMMAADEVVKM